MSEDRKLHITRDRSTTRMCLEGNHAECNGKKRLSSHTFGLCRCPCHNEKPPKKPRTFSLPRAALHFPVGAFIAWLTMSVDAPLGILLGVTFLVYEVTEDWRIKDRGFLDIAGYAYGLGAGGAAIHLVRWLA